MNAIISNKYRENIKGLGIEIAGLLEGEFNSDEIVEAFRNFYYEKLILDVTSIKGYSDSANLIVSLKKIFTFLDPSKLVLLLENIPQINNTQILSQIVALKIYNFTFDINEVKTLLATPKLYAEVVELANNNLPESFTTEKIGARIIGIKNVTSHAGATSLTYMMYQELIKNYKVKCLEMGKDDFKYFYNEDLKSIVKEQFMDEIYKCKDCDVILIDVNDYTNEMFIKEILYLIEPGVLKLNKTIALDKDVLSRLANQKIILNRSNISLEKSEQFESESNLKIFDILRNLNERDAINPQIMNLLIKLGFNKTNNGVMSLDDTERKKTLFDTFK